MIWNQVPFIRFLFPFILGICLSQILPELKAAVFWVTAVACLVFVLLNAVRTFQISFSYQWVHGALINVLLCCFGFTLTISHSTLHSSKHFSQFIDDEKQTIFMEVLKPISIKDNSVQVHVEIQQVHLGSRWVRTLGKGIIYLEKETSGCPLEVGDQWLAFVNLEEVASPRNPGAFDYAKYLSRSDIYYSAYASSSSWKLVLQPQGFTLLRSLNSIKQGLKQSMAYRGVSKEAQAVISALTLGDKNELSAELKAAYSKAGVLHILAVSGLHVGIIYMVLNYLFGFMKRFKYGVQVKVVFIILLLWCYAMITGMSPSVARACTMFSFVIIGSSLRKYINIYNTLCVSAFLLLLIDPQSLFNVGFLLSYTAVVGILIMYPIFKGLLNTNNWLLDKSWALLSVSLAAQVATFPLSLYYFHQFPNYFLLANLIVVPLAISIMYASLILFVLMPVPLVNDGLVWLLNFGVEGLNLFVHAIETLPFSVVAGIDIGKIEVLLIYITIGLGIAFVTTLRKAYLFTGLGVIFILGLLQIQEQGEMKGRRQLVVYDIRKHSCFDVIQGRTSFLTLDSSLLSDTRKLGFAAENNWRELGIEVYNQVTIDGSSNRPTAGIIDVIKGQRVLYPIGNVLQQGGAKVKVDILILSERCSDSIEQLTSQYDIGLIILDSSIPSYRLRSLMQGCAQTGTPYYNVRKEGAFVREF